MDAPRNPKFSHAIRDKAQRACENLGGPLVGTHLNFDRENGFQLYATFCGDVERTAHALNVRPVDVLKVAEDEGWLDRLKPIINLKKSARPGDVERAINRAVNFSQAHRLRLILERVIAHYSNMSTEDIIAECHTTKVMKDGTQIDSFNTKPLADLAAALERAHTLSYAALNDSMGERAKRSIEDDIAHSAREIDTKLEAAMEDVGKSKSARAMLFDAQLATAGSIKLAPPEDDSHEGNDT